MTSHAQLISWLRWSPEAPATLLTCRRTPRDLEKAAKVATESLPPPAFVTDRVIYRIVVTSLGIVAIAAMLGAPSTSQRSRLGQRQR